MDIQLRNEVMERKITVKVPPQHKGILASVRNYIKKVLKKWLYQDPDSSIFS